MPTLDHALHLAPHLEEIAVEHGFHIGLTGGLLYKHGERKDVDFVLYEDAVDRLKTKGEGRKPFIEALKREGYEVFKEYRFTTRMKRNGVIYDFIFTRQLPKPLGRQIKILFRSLFPPREVEDDQLNIDLGKVVPAKKRRWSPLDY